MLISAVKLSGGSENSEEEGMKMVPLLIRYIVGINQRYHLKFLSS